MRARPIGQVIAKRTNLAALPEPYAGAGGGYMWWMDTHSGYLLSDVCVRPRSGRVLGKSDVTGRHSRGSPAGGAFVPAGVAGIGYDSPGYHVRTAGTRRLGRRRSLRGARRSVHRIDT
jgi:hypothetical protein